MDRDVATDRTERRCAPEARPLHGLNGGGPAGPKVANRDIFACFTLANLDALVTAVDVSKQARLKWLNAQKDVPQGRKQEIAERISKLPTPGKYDHFYKVSPLLGPLGGLMLG